MIESMNHFDGVVWTFPKGKFDPGKDHSLQDTVKREVLEETGWSAEIITEIPWSGEGSNRIKYFLMYPVRREGDPIHLEVEVARVSWVRFAKAESFLSSTMKRSTRVRNLDIWNRVTKSFNPTDLVDPVLWGLQYDKLVGISKRGK